MTQIHHVHGAARGAWAAAENKRLSAMTIAGAVAAARTRVAAYGAAIVVAGKHRPVQNPAALLRTVVAAAGRGNRIAVRILMREAMTRGPYPFTISSGSLASLRAYIDRGSVAPAPDDGATARAKQARRLAFEQAADKARRERIEKCAADRAALKAAHDASLQARTEEDAP